MLAMMMAWPIVRAPLPIEVPKLHIAPGFRSQAIRKGRGKCTGLGTALIDVGSPVGHIIGANAKSKSIGEHCGACKDYRQLCGHLHCHHGLFRYILMH